MPTAKRHTGFELFYEVLGKDDATHKVVFVMGLNGSCRGWEPQSRYFSSLPDYQILVFDNRGAAFSQSPPPPYTTAEMATDVLFLADLVGFKQFHLVGVSMGGMISQQVALLAPERLISLTLIVTRILGGIFNVLPSMGGAVQMYKMHRADSPEALLDAGADLLFPKAFLSLLDSKSSKTNKELLNAMITQRNNGLPPNTPEGRQGQMAAVRSHGLSKAEIKRLKDAPFPILSIVGDEDILIKPKNSYNMPEQIGADLIIVQGAGHAVSQQCAELVNDELEKHFKRGTDKSPRTAVTRQVKWEYPL